MPEDIQPGQSLQSGQVSEQVSQLLPRKRSLATAIITAIAILALPISYLFVYYTSPAAASADSTAAASQTVEGAGQAASLSPTAENRLNLANAYIQSNQPRRAVPILNAILNQDNSNARAWNDLCAAHNMLMEFDVAMDACKNALRVQPDFQLAKNNLDWAEQQSAKARSAIANAEQSAPVSRSANDYLAEGLNFLHLGNYDQAIASWKRELQIDPKSAVAANNIGTAYMFKKDPATALVWFNQAISFDPSLQIAKNNLNWARDEFAKLSK